MDGITYRVEQVEKEVSYHRKMLLEGNGKPGLTTRMQQAEDCLNAHDERMDRKDKNDAETRKMFWAIILLLLTILGGFITDIVEHNVNGHASLLTTDDFVARK